MSNKINNKVLVFSAHPDDNIVCAGTILYLNNLGFEIVEVVFTDGENSVDRKQPPDKRVNKKRLAETRNKELSKAAKILGIKKIINLGLPDGNVTKTPALIRKLIKMIRDVRPTILISENPGDYHPDHRNIGIITQEAIDKAGWEISPELGNRYKTPIGIYRMGEVLQNVRLDLIVDITKFNEQKSEAMNTYGSQIGVSSTQLTESLDKYAGYLIRAKFAEGFQLIDNYPVRVNDLVEVFGNNKNIKLLNY